MSAADEVSAQELGVLQALWGSARPGCADGGTPPADGIVVARRAQAALDALGGPRLPHRTHARRRQPGHGGIQLLARR